MNKQTKPLKIYKASAGSGKTFRLAVEYIALLVKQPTEYQHILAVTFTHKATGEMKQRILSQLYGIAHELKSSMGYVKEIIKLLKSEGVSVEEKEVKEKCAEALSMIIHDYTNFRIVTIDSFFQSIVRELANELGLAANISVELNSDNVIQKAVDEIIDNIDSQSPEFDSLLKYIYYRLEDSKNWKIEDSIVNFSKQLLSEKFLINDNETKFQISDKENLDTYKRKLIEFKKVIVDECNKQIDASAKEALYAIENCDNGVEIKSNGQKFLESKWLTKAEITDAQYKLASEVSAWQKKCKNTDAQERLIMGTLIPCTDKIIKLLETRISVENDVNATIANIYNLMIIGKIGEQINELNKNNNRFLLAETAHFLNDVINKSNIPFIYEKTGTLINHIMIDEFQDTSTLQWNNFKPLLENSLDANQSCLIVGDVKQSIYRFRNSDWQVLNNIDKEDSEMSKYITPIEHFVNHRSSPNVIDFNNKFFYHAIKQTNESYRKKHGHECESLTTAYRNMAQTPNDAQNVYGYIKIENLTPQDDTEATKDLQLASIFENVKTLLDAGVKENDIAILVRKGFQAADICEYFETRKNELNVKIISNEAFKLESSAAINMVIFALRALSAQQDRLNLATLAYHYQTLVLGNAKVIEQMSLPFLASEKDLLEKYLPESYMKQRNALRYKSIAEIVEDVYEMFSLSKLEKQDAYMFYFHDIVESYSRDNLADIDSFLKMWDDELHNKTIPNGNSDGIQLMTIHKSKGLEFHTVIVPFCDWTMEPKSETMLWCSPTASPFDQMPLMPIAYGQTSKGKVYIEEHDQEELYTLVDNINLFYVGFTRPIYNLVIISQEEKTKKDAKKDCESKIKANNFIIEALEAGIKESDTEHKLIANTAIEEGVKSIYRIGEIVGHNGPNITKEIKEKDHKQNPLNKKPVDTLVSFVSNSSMAEFRQSNDSDLFISEKSSNENVQRHANVIRLINLGNLYHNTLQLIKTKDDIHHAILQMERRGCFEHLADKEDVEENITKLIENVSISYPEWFSGEWKCLNERAILFHTEDDEALCTKRPDRVIVKDDIAIVIDYKTARNVAIMHEDGSVTIPSENKKQVAFYCELMKQLGFKEVKGYLWYILDDVVASVN